MKNTDIFIAWGEWLRQWKWDWWVTLTFRYPVSSRQAHRLWKKWYHQLENVVHGKIHYVRVTELQRYRGHMTHYHALLIGIKDEKPEKWERIWYELGGLSKIESYNQELGATYYLAKNLTSETGDIILSKHIEKLKTMT